MIVHALRGCGMDPGYLVGGEVRATGANAGWGAGEWLVVEADESDRSLLRLDPAVALVTNAELDHDTDYASARDVEATFRAFLGRASRAAVVRAGPPRARSRPPASPPCPSRRATSSSSPAAPRSPPAASRSRSRCPASTTHRTPRPPSPPARSPGPTRRPPPQSLRDFTGAGRRFERLGRTPSGAEVVDDYAHHPTEVRATLEAARTLGPGRLVAVFQPHLYSRTRTHARGFGAALALADRVVVLDVYPARERAEDFPGVTGRLVAAAAADAAGGRPVAWLPGFDAAEAYLRRLLRAGDVCLVLGAGDVDALGRRLVVAAAGTAGNPAGGSKGAA